MTKRFTGEFDKQYSGVYDNGEQLTNFEVVKLLNELHEEKQHLQRRCGAMQEEIEILSEENKQLKQDKDDLIDFIKKEFPKSHKHILGDLE